MILILTDERVNELIRNQQGNPDLDAREIAVHNKRFLDQLFGHIAEFGVRYTGTLDYNVANRMATVRVDIDPIWQESDKEERLAGIAQLKPLSISIEERDIASFIPHDETMQTNLIAAWGTAAPFLENLRFAAEIPMAIEKAAQRVVFGPPPRKIWDLRPDPPADNPQQFLSEQGLEDWMAMSGKSDVLTEWKEQEAREAARKAGEIKAKREQTSSGWGVMIDGKPVA